MSNFLYDFGREGFLDGSIDWDTDDIRVVAVTSGYSAVQATDQYLSAISGGFRVAVSSSFSSKTVTGGIANAASVTLASVTGSAITQLVIYKHTGTDSTSRLIAHIDTYSGLPFTPSGGDIVITWPTGTNKIFKL